MTEREKGLKEEISETLACSAFAEAGEPCPLPGDQIGTQGQEKKGVHDSVVEAVEKGMACAAFCEENVECPGEGDDVAE